MYGPMCGTALPSGTMKALRLGAAVHRIDLGVAKGAPSDRATTRHAAIPIGGVAARDRHVMDRAPDKLLCALPPFNQDFPPTRKDRVTCDKKNPNRLRICGQ